MTNYEKFLKGEILPYKGQILEDSLFIHTYKISIYKARFYILIMKSYPRYDVYTYTRARGVHARREHTNYKKFHFDFPVGEMVDFYVMERRTLKTLKRFLKYPSYYLYQKKKEEYDKI